MSRAKGLIAPSWVAAYLQPWYPGCEKQPNSRRGRDILGTPGVAIEVKTGAEWRPNAWTKQTNGYPLPGEVGLLIYLPPGFGAAAVPDSLAIMPLRVVMPLLVAAGYAPEPRS